VIALSGVRRSYLSTVDIALELLRDPAVEPAWDEPSGLPGWMISGLCGHLARSITNVERYLDSDVEPHGEVVGAGRYYALVVDNSDLDSELHRTIRQRGDETAARGYAALLDLTGRSADHLRERLVREPKDRVLAVFKGVVLSLDDYLATRIVELLVHIDDLAVGLGLAVPELPSDALEIAIESLIDTARERHGDLAIVRALTRRERDDVQALRVF
jgi:uncharacterized protein (TIGR03083 family)